MRLFSQDLVLLHPPSVYDFRRLPALYGPISDVVPSTPVFEMYPVGLTSIASHLENHGFNVLLVNVAYRMLRDPSYQPEAELARLKPLAFGIDLHWLPHAHGATELAHVVKRLHPDVPIIMGGLSSSYFHRELIEDPAVDFVMRGDSTEGPMLEFMRALSLGEDMGTVPNLTWKRANGDVVVNELSHVPSDIDSISLPNIEYVVRSVFKYSSLANVLPFADWLDYPVTALLTSRGCAHNCSICGGSRTAYRKACNRSKPAFRSPEALVRDIRKIETLSRAPIMLLNDVRMGGRAYVDDLLTRLKAQPPRNELIFELFTPVEDDFLERVSAVVPRFSIEVTLESHVERIRKLNGKFPCSNEAFEETMRKCLDAGARRIDLFFMVGLPDQTYDEAVGCVEYAETLLHRFNGDKRLWFFVAPLAPFLDPGSPAFEDPDAFGYRSLCRTLADHRRALQAPTWKHILSYETKHLTRDDIVAATYEAMERLAVLKREWGIIDHADCEGTLTKIASSRVAIAEVDEALKIEDADAREQALRMVMRRARDRNSSAPNPREELKWPLPGKRRFAPVHKLAALWMKSQAERTRLFLTRRLPLVRAANRGRD